MSMKNSECVIVVVDESTDEEILGWSWKLRPFVAQFYPLSMPWNHCVVSRHQGNKKRARVREREMGVALNPDIWCKLVTCKSGQSPSPLHFQIFKVCLDSRPRALHHSFNVYYILCYTETVVLGSGLCYTAMLISKEHTKISLLF